MLRVGINEAVRRTYRRISFGDVKRSRHQRERQQRRDHIQLVPCSDELRRAGSVELPIWEQETIERGKRDCMERELGWVRVRMGGGCSGGHPCARTGSDRAATSPSASSQPSTNSLDMATSRAGSVPRTVYGSFPDPPFHNAEGNAQRAISTINIRA